MTIRRLRRSVGLSESNRLTALKTISMFLRAAKTEAEAAGIETEGMASSVSKLRDEILTVTGVDIMLDESTFKSTYQILKEISSVWDELADVDRANIAERLAGKRQGNILSSIVENFGEAESVVKALADSEGSALEENEKYLDSIKGHSDQLAQTFERISTNLIDSDVAKVALDFLNSLAKVLEAITENGAVTAGVIGGIGLSISKLGINLRGSKLRETIGIVGLVQDIFVPQIKLKQENKKDSTGLKDFIREFQELKSTGLNTSQIFGMLDNSSQKIGKTFKVLSSNGKDVATSLIQQKAEASECRKQYKNFREEQRKFEKQLKFSSKALNVLKPVGSFVLNAVASHAIGEVFEMIAEEIEKAERAAEVAKEAADSFKSELTEIDDYINKVAELRQKQASSNTSTSESIELTNQLKDIQSELVEKYNLQSENINIVNGDLKEQLRLLEDIKKTEFDTLYMENSLGYQTAIENIENPVQFDFWKAWGAQWQGKNVGTFFDTREQQSEAVQNFMAGLAETFDGITVSNARTWDGIQDVFNDIYTFDGAENGKDAYNRYLDLAELFKKIESEQKKYEVGSAEYEDFDAILQNISQLITETKSVITENDGMASQMLIYGDEYGKLYSDIQQKKEDLEKSVSEKNYKQARTAQENLEDAIANLMAAANMKGDTWVGGYLEYNGIYDDLKGFENQIKEILDGSTLTLSEYTLKNYFEIYKTDLESILETQDLLQSAYDKISQGTSLTREEFLKLVDAVPSLSSAFTQVADGYVVDKNKIISANSDISESLRNSLIAELENVDIARSNALADFIESSVGSRAYGYMSEADKSAFLNAHPEEVAEIDRQYQETINSINTILGMLGITNIKLSEYNDELTYTAKLQKNLVNLNEVEKLIAEGGQISTDMLQNIKEAYPELASYITAYTASYSKESGQILVDEFRKAYNTDVENFHTYLNNKNSVSKATDKSFWQNFIENNTSFVEEFKKAYGIDLVNFETYLDAKEEAVKNRAHYDYLPTSDLQKLLDETGTDKLEEKFNSYSYTVGSDTDGGGGKEFKVSEDYEKQVKFWDDQLERGLISYDAYLEKRRNLIKQYYTDATAYAEALTDFEYSVDYGKLFEEEMSAWERKNNYDSNNADSRIARAKQQQTLIDSYFSPSGIHPDVTQYENQINELAKYEVETLENQLEQGLISYSDYCSSVKSIRDRYVREDGSYVLPANFVTDLLTADKQYENSLKEWQNRHEYNDRNNKDIGYRQDYANEWRRIAEESYGANSGNYNPAKLAEIYKEIKEYEEETWELRKDYVKNYWEERKSEIEEYYDSQIEALQAEQEELDKINELEEKRLELIKARKELEDAQKNRNQLIFANGNFSYEYDQDAILEAQERVKNAEDALKKQETDDAVQALEDAKNETVDKIDDVITAIENQGSTEQKINDRQVVDTSLNEALNKGELSKDEYDDTKSAVVADNAVVQLADANIIEQIRSGVFAKTATEIAAMLMGTPIGASSVGATEMQRLTDTATSTITNSTVNTDNSTHVTVGDIKVSVQGGTSEAMLREFADGLANEINAMVTRRKR